MADGEDIGEEAAPQTIMEAALTSGPPPKKNLPPTILPLVSEHQQDDVLAKGKEAQGDVFSSSILEHYIPRVAELNHIVDLLCRRVSYLAAQGGSNRGLQHQPKDIKYTQKIGYFIMKQEDSSLDEILSEEMDLVFLRQLVEDILDSQESSLDFGLDFGSIARNSRTRLTQQPGPCSTADTEEAVGISLDPALAALVAAPSSCHRRGNADELLAPIPDQW